MLRSWKIAIVGIALATAPLVGCASAPPRCDRVYVRAGAAAPAPRSHHRAPGTATTSTSAVTGSTAATVAMTGCPAGGCGPRVAVTSGWMDDGRTTAAAGTTSKATGASAPCECESPVAACRPGLSDLSYCAETTLFSAAACRAQTDRQRATPCEARIAIRHRDAPTPMSRGPRAATAFHRPRAARSPSRRRLRRRRQ